MIFRVGMISRRSDLTEGAFRDHWRLVHGVHASKMPGLRWYRQNHIVKRYFQVEPWPLQPVDGLSQLQFDSIEAMEQAERSEAYETTKKDIPNFQGAITILVISPAELASGPREGYAKAILLARCDEAADEEQRLNAMKGLIKGTPALVSAQYNAVVDKSHPVAAGVDSGQPDVDAFIELFFEGDEARNAGIRDIITRDQFLNDRTLSPVALYGVEEFVVV